MRKLTFLAVLLALATSALAQSKPAETLPPLPEGFVLDESNNCEFWTARVEPPQMKSISDQNLYSYLGMMPRVFTRCGAKGMALNLYISANSELQDRYIATLELQERIGARFRELVSSLDSTNRSVEAQHQVIEQLERLYKEMADANHRLRMQMADFPKREAPTRKPVECLTMSQQVGLNSFGSTRCE